MVSGFFSAFLISVLLFGLGAPNLSAQETTPVLGPSSFSPVVTNPLFPLASIDQ